MQARSVAPRLEHPAEGVAACLPPGRDLHYGGRACLPCWAEAESACDLLPAGVGCASGGVTMDDATRIIVGANGCP